VTSSQPTLIADRYELTQGLLSGGMGRVWIGYDQVLDRVVAVKLIRPDLACTHADREELAARFRREARVTAKIEHPGVPAVYDAAIDPELDQLYLVMQLVHGVSLADFLAEYDGPLPIAWAAAIAAQICAVLSHAHAVPVVHRDLKPGNIMVARDGTAKVLDFGIAAVLGTDVTRLTSTGQALGTHAYMSPEQVHASGVSPRSDLYGLGCLLHEMLCGQKVFDGASAYDLMRQHINDAPTPLCVLRRVVPEPLERLVLDLLAKDPEHRPASAQDVYDRLVPFLPTSAGVVDSAPPPPGGLPDPTRPYRQPLAPRPRPTDDRIKPHRVLKAEVASFASVHEQAVALIDAERVSQASELLAGWLSSVAGTLGREDPDVLEARITYAAALFLGRDYRRALPEFERLAESFARVSGADDERVLECQRQVAYCRAELGDTTAALADFQALLGRTADGGRNSFTLDLRRQIVRLLLSMGRTSEFLGKLPALLRDSEAEYGPGAPEVLELRDLLELLRRTEDDDD
jgi:eukaryotic-like serine/threonine-protein kinase